MVLNYIYIVSFIIVVKANYWEDRAKLIENDEKYAIGSNIVLNNNEKEINRIFMADKSREYDDGFEDPGNFSPAIHFFHARPNIEKSQVFKLIKELPKGASLHGHDAALVSFEYLYNLTYRENLYSCIVDGRIKLQFFNKPDTRCSWSLVSDSRRNNKEFDDFLKSQLTLEVPNPKVRYPDINTVWTTFMCIFSTVVPMITYKPIFEEYFYQVLKELYEDNIKYVEFRSFLPTLYDLNGFEYGPLDSVKIYKETADKFQKDYPDFIGAKLIYAPSRKVDNMTMLDYIAVAKILKRAYPDFIAGFDLVGQEDMGKPLKEFINEIQDVSRYMQLFFHAGETNWYGTSTDENLFDAVLLGTTRIGHGFALVKHPELLRLVMQNKIGVEISPISNQVLMLLDDLRNHPASVLMALGFPVVICNDDPGFWGAKGLSYDWYMAFMGMASRNADLRFLKQLALNSFTYSAMNKEEKGKAIHKWEKDWEAFIQTMSDYYFNNNVIYNKK